MSEVVGKKTKQERSDETVPLGQVETNAEQSPSTLVTPTAKPTIWPDGQTCKNKTFNQSTLQKMERRHMVRT
jgi:hypothetical protein